jgi:hypothetical protein
MPDSSQDWTTVAITSVAPGLWIEGYPVVAVLVQKHKAVLVQKHKSDAAERTVLGYTDGTGKVWPKGDGMLAFNGAWANPGPGHDGLPAPRGSLDELR